MKELFSLGDADFISVIEYVNTFLNKEDIRYDLFQLPPIQRNAVWNVSQIEKLWDSILRGFPIGSFLVAYRNKEENARNVYSGIQSPSNKEGYFLLDGQQRTRALLLGFKPNLNARLWIDLNPALEFDNSEFNDRKFLFRLLTKHQPWGMSDRNPLEKIYENQKYLARKELNNNTVHYDYQVLLNCNEFGDNNSFSWPIKSKLPIPFDLLVKKCGGLSGQFIRPSWSDIKEVIPQRYFDKNDVPNAQPAHLEEILEGLRNLLAVGKKSKSVVLLLQENNVQEKNIHVQDDMEVLFRRINAGGTILQGEEMAYSLLKSSWDGAYEMVSEIIKDEKINYLLSPTGIVSAASRLARFIQNNQDMPSPGIGYFRKWIGEKGTNHSFLDVMQSLLIKKSNEIALFHKVMRSFCETTIYKGEPISDIGLPKKLLLAIKPLLYHPVFIWIYKNNCDKTIVEANKKNILRFLLYNHLTIDRYDKVSKKAIEVINNANPIEFPDKQIYLALLEDELTVLLPTPNQFAKPFQNQTYGDLRSWSDLFQLPDDEYNLFRQYFWRDSKNLLLWYQRASATEWFKGYDPTSEDNYDTPFDWDHIVPRSHLFGSGSCLNLGTKNQDEINEFTSNRDLFVNSIGNYRMWPNWANRGDSNRCHTYKLRIQKPYWDSIEEEAELKLNNTQDFFESSVINYEDEELWKFAGGEPKDWPEPRRIAWQKAVENRVCYLYEMLFETFEFEDYVL